MPKKLYKVNELAEVSGVSIRTLHYYDEIGLLQPEFRSPNNYRQYGEESLVKLQQILFFRELGFNLNDIKTFITRPDFNIIEALQSQRTLLQKKADRLQQLMVTIDKTIITAQGNKNMNIKEYYEGFSDQQIEKYRNEVKERWGSATLSNSELRITKMGKVKFAELQKEGERIFQSVADNMSKGIDSSTIQNLVKEWRDWLEHFSNYSDEAALGLGQVYSQHPDFIKYYRKYGPDMPEFFTRAIEYYFMHNSNEQ